MIPISEIELTKGERCPECGGNLIHDSDIGEAVCCKCGLVVQSTMIDMGPEWRAFTPEEKVTKSRVGPPQSYAVFDKGLFTSVGGKYDAHGNKLSAKSIKQMQRLRRSQIRVTMRQSVNRNLIQAMHEIHSLSDHLNLPSLVEEKAALIYRRALNKGIIRGRSIKAMTVASLYAAVRITNTPRTLEEISSASSLEKSEIARNYRVILRKLDIKPPVPNPIDYITKIGNRANIPAYLQVRAVEMLKEAKEKHILLGKDPRGLAGAALYLLSKDLGVTQFKIAKAAKVTEVTIRNRCKELKRELYGFESNS